MRTEKEIKKFADLLEWLDSVDPTYYSAYEKGAIAMIQWVIGKPFKREPPKE